MRCWVATGCWRQAPALPGGEVAAGQVDRRPQAEGAGVEESQDELMLQSFVLDSLPRGPVLDSIFQLYHSAVGNPLRLHLAVLLRRGQPGDLDLDLVFWLAVCD